MLREYATSEVALVVTVGNRSAGKSFFCDKVLNLSEVRGNHVLSCLASSADPGVLHLICGALPSKRAI